MPTNRTPTIYTTADLRSTANEIKSTINPIFSLFDYKGISTGSMSLSGVNSLNQTLPSVVQYANDLISYGVDQNGVVVSMANDIINQVASISSYLTAVSGWWNQLNNTQATFPDTTAARSSAVKILSNVSAILTTADQIDANTASATASATAAAQAQGAAQAAQYAAYMASQQTPAPAPTPPPPPPSSPLSSTATVVGVGIVGAGLLWLFLGSP
jgi:hypothetical protein